MRGTCLPIIVALSAITLLVVNGIAFTTAPKVHSKANVPTARGDLVARRAGDYWEAEWICADCGYIYNERAFGATKFEDLQMGFKCPACAAPRRRFARKLGDKIGTTLDGGDGPILIFSAVSLVAIFVITYLAIS